MIDAQAGIVRVLRASDLTQQFSYVTDATRIAMPPEVFLYRAFTRLQQLKHLISTKQIDRDFYWLKPSEV